MSRNRIEFTPALLNRITGRSSIVVGEVDSSCQLKVIHPDPIVKLPAEGERIAESVEFMRALDLSAYVELEKLRSLNVEAVKPLKAVCSSQLALFP